jgi:hypothetical protein
MPNIRKHHANRAATNAERVAAHRERKRLSEVEKLRTENFKRTMLTDEVRDTIDAGIDALNNIYGGDETAISSIVEHLNHPQIKTLLRFLLFEERLPKYEPILKALNPDDE